MAYTYDYMIERADEIILETRNEAKQISKEIANRIDADDYYFEDLVERLSTVNSVLFYVEYLRAVFVDGSNNNASPLAVAVRINGEDEAFTKGKKRYQTMFLNILRMNNFDPNASTGLAR